jgi:hypothetical protein
VFWVYGVNPSLVLGLGGQSFPCTGFIILNEMIVEEKVHTNVGPQPDNLLKLIEKEDTPAPIEQRWTASRKSPMMIRFDIARKIEQSVFRF